MTARAKPMLIDATLTVRQRELKAKHGTPAEFARAVYAAVPGDISMDEARDAVAAYNRQWDEASEADPSPEGPQ